MSVTIVTYEYDNALREEHYDPADVSLNAFGVQIDEDESHQVLIPWHVVRRVVTQPH